MTRRLAAAMFAAAALAGCAADLPRYHPSHGAQETGFYEDAAAPRLALLEYRLGRYFALRTRPYAVVCAADTNLVPSNPNSRAEPLDPSIERRLLVRFPGLSPLARCERRGLDIVAGDTGQAAAIFDVNDFACSAPDLCLGWGGYYANGRHGWSFYRLRYRDGAWRIRTEPLNIQVT